MGFDSSTSTTSKVFFTTDQLEFRDDGSVMVTFFGIKNDTSRSGFKVVMQPHSDPRLDAVCALRSYINRTNTHRSPSPVNAVFLGVRSPYNPLTSVSIARILEQAIDYAGLKGQGYTAKSFRPTEATRAIDMHVDPHVVQSIGRWKSTDVFFRHYVHSATPVDFSDDIV